MTGVSRSPKDHGSNVVYGRLRDRGYEVFAVNPCTDTVEGDRAFGGGSVSPEAIAWGREHGLTVIDGGCPLMFGPTADGGHKVMRAMLRLVGTVPRRV